MQEPESDKDSFENQGPGFWPADPELKGACPKCGGKTIATRLGFRCQKYVRAQNIGCNFVMWRKQLSKMGGSKLTNGDAEVLLSGGWLKLSLVSQKHHHMFVCMGKLEEVDCNDKQRRWGIKLYSLNQMNPIPKD